MSDAAFSHHEPCEDCGSSDALGVYDDGHAYCFVCDEQKRAASGGDAAPTTQKSSSSGDLLTLAYEDLRKRRLRAETCRHWGYGTATFKGKPVQVATYRNDNGTPVAQKVRFANKDFLILGNAKAMGLYGKHLCRDTGRKVVVTEGEIDALSVSQVQNLKYAVVSVPNGAKSAAKAVAKELEWLSGFDDVVFMFDDDEPGRKAAVECAELLPPGKAKIAKIAGFKDASEALQANKGAAIVDAIWGAKVHRPDGIVDSDTMLEMVKEARGFQVIAEVPFPELQEKTRGFCPGQVWCITSGSGMGKTEFCREIAYSIIQQGVNIGYVALEENTERTALGLVGLHLNRRLHLEEDPLEVEGFMDAWDAVIKDKVYCYDHFGSMEGDNLVNKLRYMIVALGLRIIVLDHLSIVVSGMEDDDERRTIDRIMTRLKSLAQETGACILVVSHLKRPAGVPHEEGGRTSLGQLRGSAAIGQLSNIAVGLERDQQDEQRSNITTIRILKNREVGITGLAGEAKYDPDTGRMLPFVEGLQVESIDCSEPETTEF